jgi:hypothetical protein
VVFYSYGVEPETFPSLYVRYGNHYFF